VVPLAHTSLPANCISIGSDVSAGLISVRHTHHTHTHTHTHSDKRITERATSVATGRIYQGRSHVFKVGGPISRSVVLYKSLFTEKFGSDTETQQHKHKYKQDTIQKFENTTIKSITVVDTWYWSIIALVQNKTI